MARRLARLNTGKRMLVSLAKQIAGWEFKDTVHNAGLPIEHVVTASQQERMAFDAVYRNYPDIDATDFRRMVNDIRQKNRQAQEKFFLDT